MALQQVEGMVMATRYCPVQYEGQIDGHDAYFRARGRRWSFTVARPGDDPVWPGHPDGPLFEAGGEYDEDGCGFCAGYMDLETAGRLISQSIAAFRLAGGSA